MNYLKFDFETENTEQLEQLIALLAEQGFEGFEENEHRLDAFIPETVFDDHEFARTIDIFSTVIYTRTVVENINWNKKWEEDYRPVLVDDFVAIRAYFHEPVIHVTHEIIITPKMSFGTGHHATTYLVIQLMQQLDFLGKSVLDFGTGTGVLAILASKLQAAKVLAIDYDEWSINNANENVRQNNCVNIQLVQSDTVPITERFDVILANITLNIIIANLPSIVKSSLDGAALLFSGLLKGDEMTLIAALEAVGLTYLSTLQRGDWIAVTAKKPENVN